VVTGQSSCLDGQPCDKIGPFELRLQDLGVGSGREEEGFDDLSLVAQSLSSPPHSLRILPSGETFTSSDFLASVTTTTS
jgi:hypothetical protein